MKDNYKPGIFGEKSDFAKRFAKGFGDRPKVEHKQYKPKGEALARSKALINQRLKTNKSI